MMCFHASLIKTVLDNVAIVLDLLKELLSLSSSSLLKRRSLFALMNVLYFGSMLVAALITGRQYALLDGWGAEWNSVGAEGFGVMFMSIFLFNLVVSGFLMLTLTGLLFFALPTGFLIVRAALWGSMLNQLSTPAFLAALPTLLLEGEGYVIAGVAGANLGLSWLKPSWISDGVVSRRDTLKQAVKECTHLYVLVAALLLAAAVVETSTIHFAQFF